MSPLFLSILFHAVGATSAAVCYTPQKRVQRWSWQSFWLTQAAFCWFLLPILGAFLTVPDFVGVVREVPGDVIFRTFLLGAFYGIGGTAFGMAIRYVGFSITYAMAIGISMVGGTAYAIAKGDTTILDASSHLQAFFEKTGSMWVLSGLGIGLVGIAFCGVAGKLKEIDHAEDTSSKAPKTRMALGLVLCVVAGLLSAVYGMALSEGAPLAEAAAARAGGRTIFGIDAATFSSNAIYPFSNAGAFLTTALYCIYLHRKHKTAGEIIRLPAGTEKASLSVNWIMAIITGCLWYGQFFFYGFGHFYILKVEGFEQTCWAVHMILLILIGTFVGILFKEWVRCKFRTYLALGTSLVLLIAGKLALDYGNYLGGQATAAEASEETSTQSH